MGKDVVTSSNISNIYSLTPLQEGMLYDSINESTTLNYIVQNVFGLEGEVKEELLWEVFSLLSQKYDVLRTNIIYEKLSQPRQVVLKEREIEHSTIEFTAKSDEEKEEMLIKTAEDDVKRGFDLSKDSLFRVKLIKFNDGSSAMIWTYHHIIVDGWCLSILFEDFIKYYNKRFHGQTFAQLKDEVEREKSQCGSFGEYVKWIENQDSQKAMEYWRTLLDEYEESANIKPCRKPEETQKQMDTAEISAGVDLSSRLISLARNNNVTISAVIEAAWGLVLQKYAYSDDVVYGKVVSGRNAQVRGIEKIVGLFINTIPVRVKCEETTTPVQLFHQIQDEQIESEKYSYCSLAHIQAETVQKSNLIKTLFVFENYEFDQQMLLNQSNAIRIFLKSSREQNSLDLTMLASMKEENVQLKIMYNPQVYAKEDIEAILQRILKVLMGFLDSPNSKISYNVFLSEEEKKQILYSFNQTEAAYDKEKTIHQLFEEQAAKSPDSIAIVAQEEKLTYRELNEKANSLARKLVERGVKKDTIVGIMSSRSFEMIIGIYAILKAGGAYLPISNSFPRERKEYLLKDSGAEILLVDDVNTTESFHGIEIVNLKCEELYHGSVENLSNYDSQAIAYVIYTSGSTGEPKGVMIEHASVINRLQWMQKKYPLTESDTLLQKTTFTFDVSVWELFWWSWYGARLCLLADEGEKDPEIIVNTIEKYHITTIHFVPSMFTAFLLHIEDKRELAKVHTLRKVFTSGEALSMNHIIRFNQSMAKTYGTTLHNLYGPTEATVDVTYYDCAEAEQSGVVPIGKPIDNTKIFIVDKAGNLQPVGVPGELLISGDCLARGYLRREELTAEKFVKNVFTGEGRMYYTGDLARWLPDGNIEYLGRIDDQVKIRGMRIELGEIENAIKKLPNIKDAAVIVREDGNKNNAIHAYYVSELKISTMSIKAELNKLLPEYMVPAYLMQIDTIPVTSNGKLNRRMLPVIQTKSGQEYEGPRNQTEKVLCECFSEILGVERVGIRDSFFELGGDSIIAIRMVSKMRNAGFKLAVKDIMTKITVEAIAPIVKIIGEKKVVERKEVAGIVPLTPSIQRFEELGLEVPEHFNQDVLIHVGKTNDFNTRRVLRALTVHHDILRAVYRNKRLEILDTKECKPIGFVVLDYRGKSKEEIEILLSKECGKLHTSIDLENGPLLKAAFVKMDDGNQLFLCAHHLIVDSVSWQIIVEDIYLGLKQASSGKKIVFPDKTSSFIEWAEALQEYKQSNKLRRELPYWKKVTNEVKEARVLLHQNLGEARTYHVITLDFTKNDTDLLIRGVGKAFGIEITDILLCAIGQAMRKITGQNKVSIELEGHGREELHKKIDIDRTVGWFTSFYPVVITSSGSLESDVVATKEYIRNIPNKGIGYALLKDELESVQEDITFNYLGDMSKGHDDNEISFFQTSSQSSDKNDNSRAIKINAYINAGKLYCTIAYNDSIYDNEDLEKYKEYYQNAIFEIMNLCMGQSKVVKTASDYTANAFSEQELAATREYFGEQQIDDIYSLTALQEGMLYTYLNHPNTTEYCLQNVMEIQDNISIEYVEKALHLLVMRHSVLKTAFIYEYVSRPRQVIIKDREIELEVIDLTKDSSMSFEQIQKDDLKRGFRIDKDSLLRIKVVKCQDNDYRMIWSSHHIIMDGWCLSVLYGDFKKYYDELANGRNIELIQQEIEEECRCAEPYSSYVKWYENQDKQKGLSYWKELLSDYEETTQITPVEPVTKHYDSSSERYKYNLSSNTTDAIIEAAAQNNVTLNIFIEAALGIVLQYHNFSNDVVFGKVVSGRNVNIRGIERIIGLFINTIAVRVDNRRNLSAKELISNLMNQANDSNEYDYCALAEVQAQTIQKNKLIQVLYAFENYYVDTAALSDEKGVKIKITGGREQTSYDITISAYIEQKELVFDIIYDPNKFVESEIGKIPKQIENVLKEFVADINQKVSNIEIIDKDEKRIIHDIFNHTEVDYDKEETVVGLFEKVVEREPSHAAVTFNGKTLTYEELNQKANQLANKLRTLGVTRNSIVAIIADKSIEMIIGIIGVMKAGAAYVPIDPTYPQKRIQFILDDCKVAALLTYHTKGVSEYPEIALEDYETWTENTDNLVRVNKADDIAYVIYTSGTTGNPKGVMLRHTGMVVMKDYLQRLYDVNEQDCVLQFANYVFDASVWEFTISLLIGASLVIVSKEVIADTMAFDEFVEKNNVTITLLPPQYFLQTDIKNLKVLTTGGSASNSEVVRKAKKYHRYINAYGPTENTVLATHWEYEPGTEIPENIPIGKPISNTKIYIMKEMALCPIGIRGEMCIAGPSLAKGYINAPEYTSEKFIDNPFGEGKLYRTGDLARFLPDGNIEYLGRIDEQVKVRGYRIELGEIESAIRSLKGIKDVCVMALDNKFGDKDICAYYVTEEKVKQEELRKQLGDYLPEYMIPAYMVEIPEIALTLSGKPDKKALEKYLDSRNQVTDTYEEATDEYERELAAIWKELLGLEQIGINYNFFDIGGNSMLIIRMISQIRTKFQKKITIGDVFGNPTIAKLAAFLRMDEENILELKKQVFPEEFFTGQNQKMNQVFSYSDNDILYSKIMKSYRNNAEEIKTDLLFAFSYLLYETTKQDVLDICMFSDGFGQLFQVKGDEMNDLNHYRELVKERVGNSEKRKVAELRVHNVTNGLLGALFFENESREEFEKLFDYIFLVSLNNGRFEISLTLQNRNINAEKMNVLFHNYVKIIQTIYGD